MRILGLHWDCQRKSTTLFDKRTTTQGIVTHLPRFCSQIRDREGTRSKTPDRPVHVSPSRRPSLEGPYPSTYVGRDVE